MVNLSTPEKTINHSAGRHIQNKNLFSNRIHDKYITKLLKVRTTFTKDLKLSVILLIILCVYVLLILFSKAGFNKLLPKLPSGW